MAVRTRRIGPQVEPQQRLALLGWLDVQDRIVLVALAGGDQSPSVIALADRVRREALAADSLLMSFPMLGRNARRPHQRDCAGVALHDRDGKGVEFLALDQLRTGEERRDRAHRPQPVDDGPLNRLDPFAGVELELHFRQLLSRTNSSQLTSAEIAMPPNDTQRQRANRRQPERCAGASKEGETVALESSRAGTISNPSVGGRWPLH